MNSRHKILAIVPVIMLGIGLALPAVAQEAGTSPSVSAGTSLHQAGEDTEAAAKDAYHETVNALDDTKITTEVKAAFATGKDIKSGDIHVTTTAGVVTLKGQVPNSAVAARVEAIARNTEGVQGVTNDLQVPSSAAQN
ncbi:MAG TPA: BON domain-containing protein [Candidatus Acidoferrales bacterium]|nr:BON domain-containing protein [Candidatus Acidoferrales bacterium]